MKMTVKFVASCLIIMLMSVPFDTSAQSTRAGVDPDVVHGAAPLSPKARGELARQFVLRWGNHVERVYDVKVGI